MHELVARLLHRVADTRADLDLRAQEFGADLAAQSLLALSEQFRRLLVRKVAAVLVDEEIFLLDADGEARFLDGHVSYRATFAGPGLASLGVHGSSPWPRVKGYVARSTRSGNE